MNNIIKKTLTFTFILIFSNLTGQNSCYRESKIKETKICLPKIKELYEVSKNKEHKSIKDYYLLKGNKALGLYVNNSVTEVILISVVPKFNFDINTSEFKLMCDNMGKFYKKTSEINSIIKQLEQGRKVKFDNDVFIEEYSINNKIKTYIFLGKTLYNRKSSIVIKTLNLIHLKNKMIIANYMIDYESIKSIKTLRKKNDYFIMKLINNN